MATAALAFSLVFSAGTVVPDSPLGGSLPAAQAQTRSAGTSHAGAIQADLIAETPEIASEFDLSADEFKNMVSGTARQSDQINVAVPEGTPIYLRYQKTNGSWSEYYVTKTHSRLGQQGVYAFDMSKTDFDVSKHSVELSLGQGSKTEILETSMKYGAFEMNHRTNSISRVGIKASKTGESAHGRDAGIRIAPPNLQEARTVAVSQTYTAKRTHTYVRMCNFRVSQPQDDGTTDHIEVPGVVETPKDEERWVGGYEDVAGPAGAPIYVDAPLFDDATTDVVEKNEAPQRTKFKEAGNTLPEGSTVKVDRKTGAMEIVTDPETAPGNYTVDVKFIFTDGTEQTETVNITVKPADMDLGEEIAALIDSRPDDTPQVDREKCVQSVVNYGLPLLALLPLGLATQINIPGLKTLVDEIDAWFIANNNKLQMDLGIFDREAADYALRFNAKLREVAPYAADAAIGVTMVAMGVLAGTMIYDACTPDDPLQATSSLQGSSGNTYGSEGIQRNETPAGPSSQE